MITSHLIVGFKQRAFTNDRETLQKELALWWCTCYFDQLSAGEVLRRFRSFVGG
jgi:hypothetical protein